MYRNTADGLCHYAKYRRWQSSSEDEPPLPGFEVWQASAIKVAREEFADLFFPALMADDPDKFEEVLTAMAEFRKARAGQGPRLPPKTEKGRLLRLALLTLSPDERSSIKKVREFLERWKVEVCDDPCIYAAMKELGLSFEKKTQA